MKMNFNTPDYEKALKAAKQWANRAKKGIEKGYAKTKKEWKNLSDHTRWLLTWALIWLSIGWVGTHYLENKTPSSEKNTKTEQVITTSQQGDIATKNNLSNEKSSSWWEKLKNGAEIKKDKKMYFYKVKSGETLSEIKQKLTQDPRFNYLKDPIYDLNDSVRNLHSFNIGAKDLRPGLFIPIPVKKEVREVSLEKFYQSSLQAIDEMKTHPSYGKEIQKLLKSTSKESLARTMAAFARSESTNIQSEQSTPIGEVELHRREPHIWAFSFSHYHILMGKGQPGFKARIQLWITEGESYDPKNWGKMFLAYWIEKIASLKEENQKPLDYYLKIEDWEKAKTVGRIYNGSESYGEKLRTNIKLCEKKLSKK